MPVPNGTSHFDDEDIDYSDIEERCVMLIVRKISEVAEYRPHSPRCRYNVELEEGFDNILIVDGIPIIDKSKLEKLLVKICKEFGKRGAHIKSEDMNVPWDNATGKNKGCVDVSILKAT